MSFVRANALKALSYRGLTEWDNVRGLLFETCLGAQEAFEGWLEYFRVG